MLHSSPHTVLLHEPPWRLATLIHQGPGTTTAEVDVTPHPAATRDTILAKTGAAMTDETIPVTTAAIDVVEEADMMSDETATVVVHAHLAHAPDHHHLAETARETASQMTGIVMTDHVRLVIATEAMKTAREIHVGATIGTAPTTVETTVGELLPLPLQARI